MKTRTAGMVILASLFWLAHVAAQEALPSASPKPQAAGAAQSLHATAGQQVTLEVVLIDHKIAGGNAQRRASIPSAAELLDLEKQGKLDRVLRVRLSSVEQNKATVQLGERVPIATARAVGGFGRGGAADGRPTAYSYSLENIGTLISAMTRVEEAGTVLVELSVERTRLAPSGRAPDEATDAVGAQKTISVTSQSTLRLKPDEPTLAKGSQTTAGEESSGEFIVVTAHVEPGSAQRAAANERAGTAQLQVFALRTAKADDAGKLLERVLGGNRLRIGVDDAKNAVIVSGVGEQIAVVAELLQQLDATAK